MDASSKIQGSIHDVRLTYKYVSRILGTYQDMADKLLYTVQDYRKKRVIIDTDAACEADGPFAIAHTPKKARR